jgi:hypothetical protein
VVAIAFVLGGTTRSATGAEPPPTTAASPAVTVVATPAPDCLADTEAVSSSLQKVSSRVDVGVNVDKFTELVGDAQFAYDDVQDATGACADVLRHYERALQIHSDAASEWEYCIDDYPRCFVDTVGLDSTAGVRSFHLAKRWARADVEARRGDAALAELAP